MRMANRLAHAETLQEQDSAERAFNKLARTSAALVETFQRYRAASEHKVIVQHVSVNDGGQAIVGNVTPPARRMALKKGERVTPA
jgi:CHASE3 domain sensor protein